MARPSLKAEFFVEPDGTVIPKAPPLKRSAARAFFERSDPICIACGTAVRFGGKFRPFSDIQPGHIDHIIARARGGQNDFRNLQLLCMSCNCAKGAD